MSKNIIIAVMVIIVALGAGFFFLKRGDSAMPTTTEAPATQDATTDVSGGATGAGDQMSGTQPATVDSYTLAEVATHADATNCWSVINGGVYDLTAWISKHPGGPKAITGLCGKDGSAAFDAQHGGGAKQEQILSTMKVGVLAQ